MTTPPASRRGCRGRGAIPPSGSVTRWPQLPNRRVARALRELAVRALAYQAFEYATKPPALEWSLGRCRSAFSRHCQPMTVLGWPQTCSELCATAYTAPRCGSKHGGPASPTDRSGGPGSCVHQRTGSVTGPGSDLPRSRQTTVSSPGVTAVGMLTTGQPRTYLAPDPGVRSSTFQRMLGSRPARRQRASTGSRSDFDRGDDRRLGEVRHGRVLEVELQRLTQVGDGIIHRLA